MDIKHMIRRHSILVAILTCLMLMPGHNEMLAREDKPPKSSDGTEQPSPNPDNPEAIKGYPAKKRRIGTPTDVEWDLDDSFPKQGSVLELILRCQDNQDR